MWPRYRKKLSLEQEEKLNFANELYGSTEDIGGEDAVRRVCGVAMNTIQAEAANKCYIEHTKLLQDLHDCMKHENAAYIPYTVKKFPLAGLLTITRYHSLGEVPG